MMYFPTLHHNSCEYHLMIIANWKANGNQELCRQIIAARDNWIGVDLVVCPPYPYLPYFTDTLRSGFALGAQDCSLHGYGPHTGEVTCRMLRDLGCSHVIVGHSERRRLENDDIIASKLSMAKKQGITTILCIGEPLEIKQKGKKAIMSYLCRQMDNLQYCDMIAYEPIWAIGTGIVPNADELQIIVGDLGAYSKKAIIYGGSVDASKIKWLSYIKGIDGFLIGGASLHLEEFDVIMRTYKDMRL